MNYIPALNGDIVTKMAVCKALFPGESERLTDRRLRHAAKRYVEGDPYYDVIEMDQWICTLLCQHDDPDAPCYPIVYVKKALQLNPCYFTAKDGRYISVDQLEPLRHLFGL